MSPDRISFEDSLATAVIESGKCADCSACVVVCPFNCLDRVKGSPSLIKKCQTCGVCAQVCPKYEWSWAKMDTFVFGRARTPDEEFGIYHKLAIAQAADDNILKVCQDGGAVTALLSFALEKGFIDSAIVAGTIKERPFYPTSKLATTSEDLWGAAGTKYSCAPTVLSLADLSMQKKTKAAFVGTPCQVQAIRNMQMAGLKLVAPVKLVIGLMCSECFTYEGLMENHIRDKLSINLADVKKMNIKGKLLVTTDSGVTTVPLEDIKQYARKGCSLCDDFSSELADISVGGLGLDSWTFTIIRTDKGEALFSEAEKARFLKTKTVDPRTRALKLLTKISKKKRKDATSSFQTRI